MRTTAAQGMIDILPPPPPVQGLSTAGMTLSAILIVSAAVLLIWLWRWRYATRTHLRRLLSIHQSGRIDDRQAAAQLAELLRQSFQLPRLTANQPPDGIEAKRWAHFVDRLHAIRFGRADADVPALKELIVEIQGWGQYGR